MASNIPLEPKDPNGPLRVISLGRLSQPKETKEETLESLDAIRRENERLLDQLYPGPKEIRYLAEQVSGTIPERETIQILWELVATGEWDVIVAEDLSRIFRNPRFQLGFVQDAVDIGIRVICFADHLDTADEHWETLAACATLRHGLLIPDTRRRIRRTATDSFHKGGQVGRVRITHLRVSKDDAKSGKYGPVGLRIRRNPEFIEVVPQIRLRMEQGHSPLAIVDWLNHSQIPVGAYVKKGMWTLKLFRSTIEDPLLHGTRRFRVRRHQQIFKTGKYRRDRNPKPEEEHVEELAYMTRAEQEAMLAIFGWRINWDTPPESSSPHPRKGIPRKQSTWPGQAVKCCICVGTTFKCGKFLRCRHSFRRFGETCWNHIQAPIAPLRKHVVDWLVRQSEESLAFRQFLLTAIKEQLNSQQSKRLSRGARYRADIAALELKERNLRESIAMANKIAGDSLEGLVEDLGKVSSELKNKRKEQALVEDAPEDEGLTDEQIIGRLQKILKRLIETSYGMAEVLQQLIKRCEIVPVQALDTGLVRARARFEFRTLSFDPHGNLVEGREESTVDLFQPALHIALLQQVVELRSQSPRPTLKQIGAQLGTSYMTVKRALAYQKLMDAEGLTDPYRELTSKPTDASRWRDAS